MALDRKFEIKLEADIRGLEQDMQRVAQTFKQLGGEIIDVQLKVNGQPISDVLKQLRNVAGGGKGPVLDSQGRVATPSAFLGASLASPNLTMEKLTASVDKLATVMERLTGGVGGGAGGGGAGGGASAAPGVVGGGAGGGGGTQINPLQALAARFLAPAAILGSGMQIAQMGYQFPMHQLRQQAMAGSLGATDVSAMGGTSYADIARMNVGIRTGEGATGYKAGYWGNVLGAAGKWGGAAAIGGGAVGSVVPGIGTVIGAGIGFAGGAIAGGVYNILSGQAETAGGGGFQEAMRAAVEKRGVTRDLYNQQLQFARGVTGPMQAALGYGGGLYSQENLIKSFSGTSQKFLYSPEEAARSTILSSSLGVPASDVGRWSRNNRINQIARARGSTPTQIAEEMLSMRAPGRGGEVTMDMYTDLQRQTLGMTGGISTTAPIAQAYTTSMIGMMRESGGGYGAIGEQFAAHIMNTATVNFGADVSTAETGMAFFKNRMQQSMSAGGIQDVGRWIGVGKMVEKWRTDPRMREKMARNPGGVMNLQLMLKKAKPANAPTVIKHMMRILGMTKQEASKEFYKTMGQKELGVFDISAVVAPGTVSALEGGAQLTEQQKMGLETHAMVSEGQGVYGAEITAEMMPEYLQPMLEGGLAAPSKAFIGPIAKDRLKGFEQERKRIEMRKRFTMLDEGGDVFQEGIEQQAVVVQGMRTIIRTFKDVDTGAISAATALEKVTTHLWNLERAQKVLTGEVVIEKIPKAVEKPKSEEE